MLSPYCDDSTYSKKAVQPTLLKFKIGMCFTTTLFSSATPQKNTNTCIQRGIYKNFHNSIVCKSEKIGNS